MKISDLKQINKKSISNILFDWGGVITELDFALPEKKFKEIGLKDFFNHFSISHQTNLFMDLEIGKISPEKFRDEIRKQLKDETSDKKIDEAWNSILGITPGRRIKVLQDLRKKYNLYLLSNTNKIHVEYYNKRLQEEYGFDHYVLFTKVYYSHDLGSRKPDPEFFRSMLADSKIEPKNTLFIDDLEANINVAASLGINAFHLSSTLDIADLFKDW